MYGVLDSFTDYPRGLPIFTFINCMLFVCLYVCPRLYARNCNKYSYFILSSHNDQKFVCDYEQNQTTYILKWVDFEFRQLDIVKFKHRCPKLATRGIDQTVRGFRHGI